MTINTVLGNCILSAPNGVVVSSGNNVTVKSGLKCLIPDRRTSAGELNNITYEVPTDKTFGMPVSPADTDRYLFLRYNGLDISIATNSADKVVTGGTAPQYFSQSSEEIDWFDEKNNIWKVSTNSSQSWTNTTQIILGRYDCDGSSITKLSASDPVSVWHNFQARNVAKYSMPGNKYIDLTPGESGMTYISPVDGWVMAEAVTATSAGALTLRNTTTRLVISDATYSSGSYVGISIPVRAGASFQLEYLKITEITTFRIILSQGSLCS